MRECPTVSILTFCSHPSLSYGALLVFKTIRTGFPTARIEVFDNGSHPDVACQIRAEAERVGARFEAMAPRHYADHLEWVLFGRPHDLGPLVLVDPDVVFWESVEGWDFRDALAAGRLIPEQRDGRVASLARLHPSLFWVPDVGRLRAAAQSLVDPVGGTLQADGGRFVFRDTLASLYEALRDEFQPFGEGHLDAYDHLFYGSHMPLMAGCAHEGFDAIADGHAAAAAGDITALRGIWRAQDEYFRREHRIGRRDRMAGALAAAVELQDRQGMGYSDEQIAGAMQGLALRVSQPRRTRARAA